MYDELIQQARELCEKATPGPWIVYESGNTVKSHMVITRSPWKCVTGGISPKTHNAAFISEARTLVPQLCDALEAAQKEIEKMRPFYKIADDTFKHWENAAYAMRDETRNQCAKRISELTARAEKAEAENRWIPVSERLPDVTEYRNGDRYKSMDSNELVPFLVCCEDTEIPFRAFYDGNSWGDGWGKQNVTHWMPLPEPPKGE